MNQSTPETSNHSTSQDVLQPSDPEVMIRSSHPAIDRLLVLKAAAKKSGGKKFTKHSKQWLKPKPKKSQK